MSREASPASVGNPDYGSPSDYYASQQQGYPEYADVDRGYEGAQGEGDAYGGYGVYSPEGGSPQGQPVRLTNRCRGSCVLIRGGLVLRLFHVSGSFYMTCTRFFFFQMEFDGIHDMNLFITLGIWWAAVVRFVRHFRIKSASPGEQVVLFAGDGQTPLMHVVDGHVHRVDSLRYTH